MQEPRDRRAARGAGSRHDRGQQSGQQGAGQHQRELIPRQVPFLTRPSLPTARRLLFSTMAPVPIAIPNGPSPSTQNLTIPSKGEQSKKLHTEVVIIGSGPAGHTA